MEIQDQIQIEAAPAKLDVNFDQLHAALQERLGQYETVVSADGVKEAKKTATEINQLKQELARRRKEAADEAKKPIAEFEGRMKELESECESARQGILDQVKQYEDQEREKARTAIHEAREAYWQEYEVAEEHRRAEMDDLVKLTSLTQKGALTKATDETLEARVKEDRARQDKVEKRLLELENRSYRAGLAAPLSRDHVAQHLEADDETYEAELQRILDAEVEREKQATERRRQEWEREQAQDQQRQQEEQARQERMGKEAGGFPEVGEAQEASGTPDPDDDGKVTWTVNATFEIRVKPGVSQEAIEAQGRKVFEDAGIKTLQAVNATPKKGKEAA
jgi:hypothetical protein